MDKICVNCENWQPKYYGIGICVAEGLPNAKFWVTKAADGSTLMTVSSFSCQSFKPKDDLSKGVL